MPSRGAGREEAFTELVADPDTSYDVAGPSTVDVDAVLNDGGVCLVRIAQDALGVETAALMGSIVVSAVCQATTRRAPASPGERPDASLYLDEAHNFLTLRYALEDMVAAARGYRLGTTLAHQKDSWRRAVARVPPTVLRQWSAPRRG